MAFFQSWPGVQFHVNEHITDKGGDVNALNADGVVPLHDAIKRGDTEIAEELLKNGANIDIKPFKGQHEGKSPRNLSERDNEMNQLLEKYAEQDNINSEHELNGEVEEEEEESNGCDTSSITESTRLQTSSTSLSFTQQPSLLPETVAVDSLISYLCPPPQRIRQFKGLCFVPPNELIIQITASKEYVYHMKDVLGIFEKKFLNIGINLVYEYHGGSSANSEKSAHLQCIINENTFIHKEEYRMQINTHKVLIISSCLASMFHGISTFLQCLKLFRGKSVPLLQISDWPSCMNRSVVFDFFENDIPSLDVLCESIDLLALFKVNQVQISVEHITNNQCACYTKRELFELQVYCNKRFIEIVPFIKINEQSPLLSHNHSNGLANLDEEMLSNIIDSFIALRYVHIEIQQIENQKLIQQLHNYCGLRNLFLQLSTNQIDMHLDHVSTLLNGFSYTIKLTHASQIEEKIHAVDSIGLQPIICYESDQLNRLYPNIEAVISDIHQISSHLTKYNCYGLSIKLSSQSRQMCNFTSSLPNLLIAASMGWNRHSNLKCALIENIINYLIYEDDNDLIGNVLVKVGSNIPETEENNSIFGEILNHLSVDSSSLSPEKLQDICRIVKTSKQDISRMKLGSSLSNILVEESLIMLNVMFFIARICYGLLNLHKNIDSPTIGDLTQLHKSDNSNRLMTLINEYEAYCSKYYRHAPNREFVSLTLLKDLLNKMMPAHSPPQSPGLFGVFTV